MIDTPPTSTPPSALGSVRRRQGLGRRIYFGFLVAAVVPTAIAGLIGITVSLQTLRAQTLLHLQREVDARAAGLQLFFDQVAAELRFLADMSSVSEMFDAADRDDSTGLRDRASAIERNFVRLSELHPHVYQMRVLDAQGRERVRVEKHGDRVDIAPGDRLQDKSARYYVRDALARPASELYVSRLDLNEEFGRVETPERPVIRVASVVAGTDGRARGLVIVNLHARVLLDPLQDMVNEREGMAYLFDRDGQYLSRSAGQRAESTMHPVQALSASLGATTVPTLLSTSRGTIETAGQILAHAPISFGGDRAVGGQAPWLIALSFPERVLWQSVFNLYLLYAVLAAALAVTALGGYTLSRRLLGPLQDLQREAEVIAQGDFTRRVVVSGHDEIADLGTRFNRMADRLAALYHDLDAHRARLAADVADRTRELADERARLASVFRQAGDAIVAVDEHGEVTLANAAARAMFGLPDEPAGTRLADRWPGWPALAAEAAASESLRSDVTLGERVLALSVDAAGQEQAARTHVIVARDVSVERRIQDERRQLDRQMFQIEKMATLGELAMGVAHEIGNPLAGMKAVVQALQYESDLPDGMRRPLRRLEDEIDRLGGFLRSFHGFAAPMALDLHPVALGEAIDDVLFWTGKEARQQRVEVRVELAEGLPALRADMAQLKQVLLNLVVNALHAMPDGGRLTLAARALSGRVQVEVRDTGHGIAADVLPRIFDPFFTTRPAGSGLGLAITAKIVRQHGATITPASGPGEGARFLLDWPAA